MRMEGLASDIRLAVRTLATRPAFTLVVLLTLALGIGANSAIFSVVDALLLRPLPYRDPGRLVWVENTLHVLGMSFTAGADYLEWRDGSRSRLLHSSLFGVTAADPVTYVAIPFALLLVALLSSWLPARRATRVDPVVALRNHR